MNRDERELLEEHRDRALADLVDLDRQQRDGEVAAETAAQLRRRYQATAAAAMTALAAPNDLPEPDPTAPRPRRTGVTQLAYAITAAAAVFALAVLLPLYTGNRPAGGAVTGNEPVSSSASPTAPEPTPGPDRTALEAAVATTPTDVRMRTALADRYVTDGVYDRAVQQYLTATRIAPRDPTALTHFAALLLQIGQPQPALDYANQALAVDPTRPDALWSKATIQLDGLADPAGALDTLARVRRLPDLTPSTRAQIEHLAATARERQQRGGR